jgi:RNA polymerase sigma-70 factor (ECF subfamily)
MATSNLENALELTGTAALPDSRADIATDVQERVLRLFDDHAAALRRYVGSFNLGRSATEDVVQETFIALFRHLSLGRPSTNLKGWLFQVGHNLALRQRRQRHRRSLIEGAWHPAAESMPADGSNPEQLCAGRQRQAHLRRVLREMPERDRQCIYLRAEGLGYRDIAKTLSVSLGSVAKSVARALGRLAAADAE